MALSVTTVDGGDYSASSAWTKSTTCPTGSNRVLYIAVVSSAVPSSVTWNGTGLTKIVQINNGSSGYATIWRLIAPDEGAHDAVVNGSTMYGGYGIYFFEGAHQTTPEDVTSVTATGTAKTVSTSITTVTDDCYIINCLGVSYIFASGYTPTSPQTEVADIASSTAEGATSYKAGTTAGSHSMGYSWSGVFDSAYAHAVLAVRPGRDNHNRQRHEIFEIYRHHHANGGDEISQVFY